MNIIKTSEKILIWMHRNKITGQQIASNIGVTRQAWSKKISENNFTIKDLMVLKRLGYNE